MKTLQQFLNEYRISNQQKRNALNNKATIICAIDPEVFLQLTTDSQSLIQVKNKAKTKEFYQDLIDKDEIIVHPFLAIDESSGKVRSHEGRSRAWAAIEAGDDLFEIAVEIRPSSRSLSLSDVPSIWKGQFKSYTFDFKRALENEELKIIDDNVQRDYQ